MFCSFEESYPSLGKDNCERVKIHCQLLKMFPGTSKPTSTKLPTKHPLVKGIQVNLKIRLSQQYIVNF